MDSSKDSIKVCHISDCHSLDDDRVFFKECISLSEHGYEVTYIGIGQSGRRNNIERLGIERIGLLGRIVNIRKLLQLALSIDAEIYHLHDPSLLLMVKKLKKHQKKVIFDSHEDYYQQIRIKKQIPASLRRLVAMLYQRYQKKISAHLDGFIFPGPSSTIKIHLPITVVGNTPVFTNRVTPANNFANRERSVCYVGGLSEDRGITNLIRAAYKAKCKLILAGSFSSEEYHSECMRMVEYSVVDYRGHVNHEDVAKIIMEARIGISVLRNVGQYATLSNFPIKVLEYCYQGVPVFLNRTVFHNEMADKYRFAVCVDPDDINEYAEKITEYIDDVDKLQEMGNHGYNMVINEFNWNNDLKRLLDLYQSMVRGNR